MDDIKQSCRRCGKFPVSKHCGHCLHSYYCNAECQRADWADHQRACYAMPRELLRNKKNVALREAFEHNLFEEYQALKTFEKHGQNQTTFSIGRRLVFEGIVRMIRADPACGDLPDDKALRPEFAAATELIREGGVSLHADGGTKSMQSSGVFLFIPKRFHRDIDHAWDGIGGWRA